MCLRKRRLHSLSSLGTILRLTRNALQSLSAFSKDAFRWVKYMFWNVKKPYRSSWLRWSAQQALMCILGIWKGTLSHMHIDLLVWVLDLLAKLKGVIPYLSKFFKIFSNHSAMKHDSLVFFISQCKYQRPHWISQKNVLMEKWLKMLSMKCAIVGKLLVSPQNGSAE